MLYVVVSLTSYSQLQLGTVTTQVEIMASRLIYHECKTQPGSCLCYFRKIDDTLQSAIRNSRYGNRHPRSEGYVWLHSPFCLLLENLNTLLTQSLFVLRHFRNVSLTKNCRIVVASFKMKALDRRNLIRLLKSIHTRYGYGTEDNW